MLEDDCKEKGTGKEVKRDGEMKENEGRTGR